MTIAVQTTPVKDYFPSEHGLGQQDEDTRSRLFHANMALGMEYLFWSEPSRAQDLEWEQTLTKNDYKIIDKLFSSKKADYIRGLIDKPKLRPDSWSENHIALAYEILFHTMPGAKFREGITEQDCFNQAARILVHLAQPHPKFHSAYYLHLTISKAYYAKQETDYDPKTSTAGVYTGHWPDGRTRKRIRVLPDPISDSPVTEIDTLEVVKESQAARFKDRDIHRLLNILERISNTCDYVPLHAEQYVNMAEEEECTNEQSGLYSNESGRFDESMGTGRNTDEEATEEDGRGWSTGSRPQQAIGEEQGNVDQNSREIPDEEAVESIYDLPPGEVTEWEKSRYTPVEVKDTKPIRESKWWQTYQASYPQRRSYRSNGTQEDHVSTDLPDIPTLPQESTPLPDDLQKLVEWKVCTLEDAYEILAERKQKR